MRLDTAFFAPTTLPFPSVRSAILLLLFVVPPNAFAEEGTRVMDSTFVDIKKVVPTIRIDLRYTQPNNPTRQPLYPRSMPALLRFGVAQRLTVAQQYLKARGYGLKIWDAYRPRAAQEKLWAATRNTDYVADPRERIGSMHTRGTAVDATLVDCLGNEVAMPTEFDNFTPAAMLTYQGTNPVVRANLKLLQKAMARAGFYGSRTEWWHFCAGDWPLYPPVPKVQLVVQTSVPSL